MVRHTATKEQEPKQVFRDGSLFLIHAYLCIKIEKSKNLRYYFIHIFLLIVLLIKRTTQFRSLFESINARLRQEHKRLRVLMSRIKLTRLS